MGNGRTASTERSMEPCKKAGKTCCWPRKKEPVAMKNPKHMRQRRRLMRGLPETPPRASMRMSPAAAQSRTVAIKKHIAVGAFLSGWWIVQTPIAMMAAAPPDANEECGDVKPSNATATAGQSSRGDHVEGKNAADHVAVLRFEDRKTDAARCQGQHREREDVSGGAMQTTAFADGNATVPDSNPIVPPRMWIIKSVSRMSSRPLCQAVYLCRSCNRTWIVRRSVPAASKCVAQLWRRV